jgi:hypothetical protein
MMTKALFHSTVLINENFTTRNKRKGYIRTCSPGNKALNFFVPAVTLGGILFLFFWKNRRRGIFVLKTLAFLSCKFLKSQHGVRRQCSTVWCRSDSTSAGNKQTAKYVTGNVICVRRYSCSTMPYILREKCLCCD